MTTKKLEDWATAKGTPVHVIAGAKTLNGWGQGHELTEEAFTKGLDAWANIPLGGDPVVEPVDTAKAAAAPDEDRPAVFNDFVKKPKKQDL